MKEVFFSLKEKKKVEAEVTGKTLLKNGRGQIIANYNGGKLVKIVGLDDYNNKFKSVKVVK